MIQKQIEDMSNEELNVEIERILHEVENLLRIFSNHTHNPHIESRILECEDYIQKIRDLQANRT